MITEPMNTKLLETIAAIIKIMASIANIQSILYPFIIMSTPYHLKITHTNKHCQSIGGAIMS
ncbi:hypothetical protein C0158_01490 [Moraxella catarrhalis]|nr:hypothetical protein [Moraxella catarrhalis]MPX17874.1 hypothetical protein [Moraxella catarrhalis]MPX67516.1 hypothetical protein [Moraxella catarrhalis]MPX84311.1 hypothetical protein [Moraxella catarrhalis]